MVNHLKDLWIMLDWKEIVLISLITIFTGVIFYKLYGLHEPSLFMNGNNVWFQGDLPRVYENMTDRLSDGHYRVKVHPLYSLLTYLPTYTLERLGIVGPFKAVQIVTACIASLWVVTIYILFKLIGMPRVDAILFSLLGTCSASALFWLSVPESYAAGSISIMTGLLLAALASQKNLPVWSYVTVSAFTLSMTVTNWMVGILSTLLGNHWRRFLYITLIALSIVTILWGVEKAIFPRAIFFIGDKEETAYMFFPNIKRITSVASIFIFHTMLSPVIHVLGENKLDWPILSVQNSSPGSASLLSFIGVIIWAVLLGLGTWSLFTLKKLFALRIVLGLSIIGQLVLHILYGEETFLYSLHFLPLLLILAALATLNNLRTLTISLIILLIPLVAISNWLQYKKANLIAISPRHEVKKQMQLRPQDPWPKSQGHIILARPGSSEEEKAYQEPGGSFSPGVRTFGVSIWLSNPQGELLTTSDTIPLSEIQQSLDWSDKQQLPQLKTDTKYYSTIWRSEGWGSWQLNLNLPDNVPSIPLTPSLLIRSVGPAGSAIQELNWDGNSLLINKRWALTIQPTPKHIHLGEEISPGWTKIKEEQDNIISKQGWAFARFELSEAKEWVVNIRDERPNAEPELLSSTPICADLNIGLPDERFSQSLNAQIAHMMMSLVGRETRPGEPINYPLAWQRDGAYVLVALARAGKIETAKILSKNFAERDFFGGFGPEADAPGMAIWALMTVANQINQEDFDRWLWPHIYRKASFIEKMLESNSEIRQKPFGPIVPRHKNDPDLTLVTEPAREGLIIGKMDNHRPLLFVNAVSYRGLLEATNLAVRLNHLVDAKRWANSAEKIKEAWGKAFQPPLSNNVRTYISALWPTWIATEKQQNLQKQLNGRWRSQQDAPIMVPKSLPWTYFEVAEAHQWLFLGCNDHVWSTIEWFWAHQSSPGLYTWWEGKGEENTFGKWENVRGWVYPPNVTPHYWTAAEMALLQLDMLGYINEGQKEPILVIGGGIPQKWLSHKMSVQGLRVERFILDWYWNDNKMKAVIYGEKPIKVKLGNEFPTNTDLEVIYQKAN